MVKYCYILWPLRIYDGHLGHLTTICYNLSSFGTFFRFWYHLPRKIWQPWHEPPLSATGNKKSCNSATGIKNRGTWAAVRLTNKIWAPVRLEFKNSGNMGSSATDKQNMGTSATGI
jgi:hypothetical protein